MPKVGKKKFPYTLKGDMAAEKMGKKKGLPVMKMGVIKKGGKKKKK